MKKIFRMAVVCALAGATLLYTGCTKDYSDDINDLKDRVSTLESTISAIQAQIGAGYYITNVQDVDGGFKVTLSNGKDYTITNGAKGDKGDQGDKGDTGAAGAKGDTGAAGAKGDKGDQGIQGEKGDKGDKGDTGAAGKDGSVVTIGTNGNWFIDDKDTGVKAEATVDTITLDKDGYICINGVSTGVKAGTVAVWDQTAGTVTFKGINADGTDLVIGVCELESIVFVPQLYLQGIEAARYNYIYGMYSKSKAAASATVTDDEGSSASTDASAKNEWEAPATEYSFGEIATAEYHVNPNSFDLAKANFVLKGYDKEYMTRGTGTTATWSINDAYTKISRNADKNAEVKYLINNPHLATSSAADGKVAVMRLSGTVKDGNKVVDSDYEAIVPMREALHHLAFTEASAYVTKFAATYGVAAGKTLTYPDADCTIASGTDRELYVETAQAIEQISSIVLNYKDTLDLANVIEVHYHPASASKIHESGTTEESISLKDIVAKYPGLKYQFENVPYEVGDAYKSRIDKYAQIEGSVFYPCWVETDGTTQHRNISMYDGYDGLSSINHKPIVLVTLQDAEGNVLLYGYFKVKISNTAPVRNDYIIKDLGAFPYICSGDKYTTWSECSHDVLENLKMTFSDFKNTYGSPDGKTYIKKGDDFEDVTPATTDPKYGTFVYKADATGGVNDQFGIKIDDIKQLDNIKKDFNGTVTLYTKFGTAANYVYLGITVSVADPAVCTFTKHNPTYWFKANGETEAINVIINPRVPEATLASSTPKFGDVRDYSNNLDNYWTPNRVQLVLDEASEAVYKDVWNSSDKYYHYEFNSTQTCKIDGKELVVRKSTDASDGRDRIYLETDADNNQLAYLAVNNVRKNSVPTDPGEVQTYTMANYNAGVITYYNNDIWGEPAEKGKLAKEVLNKYTHPTFSATSQLTDDINDLLYFDVQLIATYADCDIPVGTENFRAIFFRPVDVLQGSPRNLKDAEPLGDKICVGDLFSAVDWQGYKIIVKDASGAYADGYYQNIVNWFEYYGITKLTLDVAKIKTNQDTTVPEAQYLFDQTDATTGKVTVEGVNNSAKAEVVKKDGTGSAATYTVVPNGEISISSAKELNDYYFNYSNNTGVPTDFKLYLPVKLEYSWGAVETELVVSVAHTGTVNP